jgi:hypothetical protein
MLKTIAPALKELLWGLIDYAGLYPPARVPLNEALRKYSDYEKGEYSWLLRWFVLGEKELEQVPVSFNEKLSVLSAVEQGRAAALESTTVVNAQRPVYCEVACSKLQDLEQVKASGCYAKIRAGGITPEAIPSCEQVAAFILTCAQLKLPFKATAGLHHPVRALYPLTYEPDAPRAVMHGFVNVLLAAAFAYYGQEDIVPILAETDASAFSFDDRAHWREHSLSLEQIKEVRQKFMHSVGSCSFEEPVHDLQALGWL